MKVQRIDHSALAVRDFERSAPFYEEILGLERAERPELGLAGAWYDIGDCQLHIIQVPEGFDIGTQPEKLSPLVSHLALRVDDYDGARQRFEEHGVEVFQLRPDGSQFWVRDPDGNTIEITRLDL